MTGLSHDVVCLGILVADTFVPPLPRLPAAGELLRVHELLLQTGGCAANTGVDLARLGSQVEVVGKVGNDVFADFICRDLEHKGVGVSGIRVSSTAPTSRTVILTVEGEDRRYIHCVGANAQFSLNDVDPELVASGRVLYVGGYLLLPGLEQASLAGLFRFAQSRGVKTVLDVAGPTPGQGLAPLEAVLAHTDVFLPNDDEARAITGESDPARQAEVFSECGVGTVVITLGARGALARTREMTLRAAAFRVEVIDPSGSGDAFDAGFMFGLLEGWELRRTLEFASAMGASACTRLGCTEGVFTRPEALAFLDQNHLEITVD